jgi:glucokinase
MKVIECYDIGGTKIRSALVSINRPKIILSKSVKSIKGDPKKILKQILEISTFLRKSKNQVIALSIGVPGPVVNGIMQKSPPLHINNPVDFSSELKKMIKQPIYVENDLKAAANAELNMGIGKKVKNFNLLTISTGIGVGIVINGKALSGAYGEFGHDVLERNPKLANRCSCGKSGCWVSMASGYGIEQTANKQIGKIDAEHFFELYKSGNSIAKKIVEKVRDYNAHGIGNLLNAFPSDMIVVMGSIGLKQFNNVIPSPKEIKKYTINRIPRIIPTKLGEEIGIFGAYFVAQKK